MGSNIVQLLNEITKRKEYDLLKNDGRRKKWYMMICSVILTKMENQISLNLILSSCVKCYVIQWILKNSYLIENKKNKVFNTKRYSKEIGWKIIFNEKIGPN